MKRNLAVYIPAGPDAVIADDVVKSNRRKLCWEFLAQLN